MIAHKTEYSVVSAGIGVSGDPGGTVGQVVRLGKSTEKTMQAFYEC